MIIIDFIGCYHYHCSYRDRIIIEIIVPGNNNIIDVTRLCPSAIFPDVFAGSSLGQSADILSLLVGTYLCHNVINGYLLWFDDDLWTPMCA